MQKLLRYILTVCCLAALSIGATSAQTKLTNADIWASGKYAQKDIRNIDWLADGKHYSTLSYDGGGAAVIKFEITTGKAIDTLFQARKHYFEGKMLNIDGYSITSDQKYIMLSTESEPIYRRSSIAEHFLFEIASKKITRLSTKGKQGFATLSPDASKIAFVRANNLFYSDLKSSKEIQVTFDGKANEIINGSCDWVYEEEFEFAQAFFWNNTSDQIAFYRFDESKVPTYNMQKWGKLYPEDYLFKYPKAGEVNSEVGIYVHHLTTGKTLEIPIGKENDQYIPRIKWTQSSNMLSIRRMNRLQNKLELLHANTISTQISPVLIEESAQYVEINDDLNYLDNGKEFIWASEKEGWKRLYLYDMRGNLIRPLTPSGSEAKLEAFNNQWIYFSSNALGADQSQLYRVGWKGGKPSCITPEKGFHGININASASYFIDNYSTLNQPATFTLYQSSGKAIKVLEDNAPLRKKLADLNLPKATFFEFTTEQGQLLKGYLIRPNLPGKVPVLMHAYGGPGKQTVVDEWQRGNFLWHQMLVQDLGLAIVVVDNRGTPGRGEAFKKATYAQLGKLELEDQIEVAKYLKKQDWVQGDRIGIWGWSFGGYLSSLCATKGADYFKAAIAVAPVTHWKFYDNIYTERFLKTPKLNPSGYEDNSPINFANQMKGNYLLIHGTGDDNVHLQNATAMQEALIRANKQFEFFTYPNKNHGIYGGNTRNHLYQMMTDFLKRKL